MTVAFVVSFAPAAGTPEHLGLSVAVAAVGPVDACARAWRRRVYVSLASSLGNANITSAYDAHRSLFPGTQSC